ncbi:MAG TPA: hypothetical protein VFH56_14175 [Acidimicrobiales bacterium]|nr:hypothetical protein [Acidimicrobiales bacterium]
MNARTIIPRTRNVQRIGYARELIRVTRVDLYANRACSGGPLHEAHGVRFSDGSPAFWFVSHEDAQRFGWVA